MRIAYHLNRFSLHLYQGTSAALLTAIFINTNSIAATPFNFEQAQQQLFARGGDIVAAKAEIRSKELLTESLQSLDYPRISLAVTALEYKQHLGINLSSITDLLNDPLAGLPMPPLTTLLPDSFDYTLRGSLVSKNVSMFWPLYTGGKITATQNLAKATISQAESELHHTKEQLVSVLVQRYFGLQLARQAAQTRADVVAGVMENDHAAMRMEQQGVISRLERLQVQAALSDAQRNAAKARRDAEIAEVALRHMLASDIEVEPQTALFVISAALEPLHDFIQTALAQHPGLGIIAAKRDQASQLLAIEKASYLPTVTLLGRYEVAPVDRADWIVGLSVRVPLFNNIDRRTSVGAAEQLVIKADALKEQALLNIETLIERNYRLMEQAREQYLMMAENEALAKEALRLRKVGLKQGTGTVLEIIEEQLNLAKVQTERSQASYDFVVELANLLEASGQSERFSEYARRADIRITRENS
ncbi:TolC family protein [Solimicrobium silvestre]|uniref:Outer membrane efflux protein n=1 Tax=Solimicrobium silvestre TaxID=2099400 RepID=A0A2S9GW18_9BURK|nr:TolC family protein [Solimicrobium silvestre]PRC91901.1 Outer membrane efflux protein [Solimicrobium silvestre]